MTATPLRRPGGRTARTTAAVHAAVRDLVAGGESEPGFAQIADRSGVHPTTLYRRWRSAPLLVLDALVSELGDEAPLPATGDLAADLVGYADSLAAAARGPRGLAVLRALAIAAADPEAGPGGARELIQPRLDTYQAIIDASPGSLLTPIDVVNGLVAPIYLRALLSSPIEPGGAELARLVANLVTISRPGSPGR